MAGFKSASSTPLLPTPDGGFRQEYTFEFGPGPVDTELVRLAFPPSPPAGYAVTAASFEITRDGRGGTGYHVYHRLPPPKELTPCPS